MPAVGKEIERQIASSEETQPVEPVGYVEKVEKQVETQQPANTQPQQSLSETKPVSDDMGKIVSAQFAVTTKPSITLPLDEGAVSEGLHHKVWEGVRWLSEWCVMMIKKYPGRVFYLPPDSR